MGTIIEQISVVRPNWHVGPSALNLAVSAARDCLRGAHRAPDDVDLLINTGLYRDRNLGEPALAALIQEDVGSHPEDPHEDSHGTFSFDLGNGSCGVLSATQVADGFLRSGAIERALVVASDADPGYGMSKDFPFAPAGGAMLCTWTDADQGFGKFYWSTKPDGGQAFRAVVGLEDKHNVLQFSGDGTRTETYAEAAAEAVQKCLEAENLTLDGVDVIVAAPGDAEFRAALAKRIGAKVSDIVAGGRKAHTSTLLFGMHTAMKALRPGSTALLVSAGAGVTAGAVLYRSALDPEAHPIVEDSAAAGRDYVTALDAAFLELEDSDRHVNLAIGGVSVISGPVPDDREIMDALVSRVVSLPRYRQVLRFRPLDLGAPEWVDDPDFDFSHHIHRTALPSPGNDAALYEFVAEAMTHRLDRDRPLWESWIIEGLSDGRWAILIKIHHCIADGIAAARAVASLCDDAEPESYADNIRAATESPSPNLLSHNPLHWPGEIVHGSLGAPAALLRAATGAAQIAKSIVWPSAESSLNGPISKQRRFGAARVSLADIAHVRRTFDVTVNDVALAAIAEAYREFLLRRGETPHPDTMRTLVPVSVRMADATGDLGNRVSLMLPLLPVDVADPIERLQTVHSRLTVAKSSGQREAGSSLVDAARYIPFMLTAQAMRLFGHFPQRGVVALATNVPGPSKHLHILGREVLEMIPVPPIALRLRTGIAMLSYAGTLTFGITADHDAAPDIDEIAAGIERAVERLVELSGGGGSAG